MFTEKDPAIEGLMKAVTGKARTEGECVTCPARVDPGHFRDALSAREYQISGMCQKCQDSVFGGVTWEFN